MEYKEIVAVTGEPGLFQLLSSKSDGAIVRSLDGQATRFVPSRKHNFTPLESIEVFTTGENVSLADVFKAMQSQEETYPVIDAGKDGKEIKKYFQTVFPSLDEERVYISDMKKMLKWYPQLKANDLLKFEAETTEDTPEEKVAVVEEIEEKKAPGDLKENVAAKEKKTTAQANQQEGDEAAKKKPTAKKPNPIKKKDHPSEKI